MRLSALNLSLVAVSFMASGCSGRDVHGGLRALRILEDGREFYSRLDLRSDRFAAHRSKGNGAFDSFPGVGYSDGVFIINDVPNEPYLLRRDSGGQTFYFATDSADVDLTSARLGRGGIVPQASTPLRFEIAGLAPWELGDRIEFVSANLGVLVDISSVLVGTGTLAPGQVALATTVDLNASQLPLIEAVQGDRFSLAQLELESVPPGSAVALTRYFERTDLTVGDGVASTVTGEFRNVERDQLVRATVAGDRFAALRTTVNADATLLGASISIEPLLKAKLHGAHSAAPDLIAFFGPSDASSYAVDLRYGDPYPSNWDDIVVSDYLYSTAVVMPGQLGQAVLPSRIRSIRTLEAFVAEGGRVEPVVSPVRNVRIQGQDASRTVAGVGAAPRLNWDAPELGKPNLYSVLFVEVTVVEGSTSFSGVARFLTRDTQVQFPIPTLRAGVSYVAQITAIEEPSRDPDRAPFRGQIPAHSADALTAVFTP